MRKISELEVVNIYPGRAINCKFYNSRGYEFHKDPIVVKDEVLQIMVKYEEEPTKELEFIVPVPVLKPFNESNKPWLDWQENRDDNKPNIKYHVLVKVIHSEKWVIERWSGFNKEWEYNDDHKIIKWAYIPE